MASKRIYVASSWRNDLQPLVVKWLREAGHEVYDFKNPKPGNNGFGWSEIDRDWKDWTPERFRAQLDHPVAIAGFGLDWDAMQWANEFCLALPCGRSAHLEAGWAIGANKPTSIFVPEACEPELMYRMAARIVLSRDELIAFHAEER